MDAKQLIELINGAGWLARSYSGRGMYGKKCVGVSTEDAYVFIADFIRCAKNSDNTELLDEALDMIVLMSEDSLGRGLILYWRRMLWPEDMEIETDDTDEDN